MLKQRIITACILIPIVVALLFYLPLPLFFLLSTLIMLAGAWEWSQLVGIKRTSCRFLYLILMMLVFFNSLYVPFHIILVVGGVWWVIALILMTLYPRLTGYWAKGYVWRGLMGIFVLLPCWVALNFIRNQQDGIYALLFLFVLIWGADSAAYFSGKKWGRHPLAFQISPGKTVEGVMGALIFTLVIALLALWLCNIPSASWLWSILLSLVTVIFSIVGDLFESAMKRQIGLKDSGKLLPGHGGLLDRIDSLTSAAPIFALGGLILGKYLA